MYHSLIYVKFCNRFHFFNSVRAINWLCLLADVSNLLDNVPTKTALMCSPGTPSCSTEGEREYPPPYNVEQYIRFHVSITEAHLFEISLTGEVSTICVVYEAST